MVSEQIIKIILKAEDLASQQTDKIKDKLKGLGDTAKRSHEIASKSAERYKNNVNELDAKLNKTIDNVNKVGNEGSKSFRKLSKEEQDAVVKFNTLNEATQTTLTAIREVGVASANMFPDGNRALTSFSQLDNLTKSWAGSLEYAKTKMSLLGNDTTTLRGKIQTTGMAIQTYLGTKWDAVKQKANSAITGIKEKLDSLKNSFAQAGNKLTQLGSSLRSAGASFGFLRNAASMTVGMIGYDLVNSFIESGRSAINAQGQLEYFGKRLNMSSTEVSTFNNYLENMQSEFRKVNMKAVGASAEEMAVKLKLPTSSLQELTKATAVMSSAFVKEGRTQEDAILAVSDALDGQFRRLQELGITQDMLKNNGWNGDLADKNSLLQALNKTLDDMGFTETAQDITSLEDAFQALSVSGGDLLASVLIPLTPTIVGLMDAFINAGDMIKSAWNNLPDWAHIALMITGVGLAITALALAINANLIPGLIGAALHFILVEAQSFIMIASNFGLSAAFTILAGSIWATVAALVSFVAPILAVIAVLALIAAAIYKVGKAFQWWNNVGEMLDAIKDGIRRLWEAFINHPDVQAAISGINWALQELGKWIGNAWTEVLKFFGVTATSNWDPVLDIINAIGIAWQAVSLPIRAVINIIQFLIPVFQAVGSAVQSAQSKFGVFGGFLATLASPILFVYELLKKVVCILLGCSPGIVPALQQVQEVFMTVWSTIAGFIGGLIETVVAAIQPIIDILTQITDFYLSTFIFAWQTLVMVFNTVMVAVNQIIMIFSMFLSGQINLSTMLTMIWTTVSNMFATVLNIIISRVRSWASSMISRAIAAGQGFVNGIISFITGLPGKVASILANVLSRIISAGSQWVSNARSKASAIVSGVISQITQLPGKVGQEFMNIGSRMLSEGSQLIEKAKQIGKNIVDGLLGAMGIHSPGIIQTKVVQEFEDMTGRVEDQIEPAGEVAKTFGETMVNQFGDVSLTPDLGYTDLDMPEMNMNVGMDSSMVSDTNSMVTSSYDELANTTGAALQSMVEKDRLAYEAIRMNDSTQLSAINTDVQQKMNMIGSKVNTSINTMVNKNQTGLASARNTTQTQLNNITNATVKANKNMISSWTTMKDGIVSAANKIKSDSTKHFDSLSSTIGTFYGKLKNPSRWGAGPGNGRVSGVTKKASSSTSGVGRINRAIKKMGTKYLTLGQVKQNPLLDYPNFGDYIIRGDNNRYDLGQLVKYGALTIPIGIGAGGWEDTAPSHVSLIKNTSREWDMSSPNIGRYSTSAATFKVKEFENGAPQIAYDTFRQLAEEVFGQTQYEFYYDDDHHGNWLNAFNAASMNCKHGAEALIAMAGAMGLSGHMVHGHWNEFGHYWASIEGHKMDVTGWQNRRTWTPSASAGPAPKSASYSISDLFSELKTSIENQSREPVNGEYDEIQLGGSVTIVHEFLNLPPNIDEEEVARIVNETSTDDSWIKKLVQNRRFQKWDLKEKARLNGRDARARGV